MHAASCTSAKKCTEQRLNLNLPEHPAHYWFLTFTNRLTVIPNWQLSSATIENLKRSPPANVKLDLAVPASTTALQLERLQKRLRVFTESEGTSFKPGVFFRVRGVADGLLLLSVWASSHHNYGAAPEVYVTYQTLRGHAARDPDPLPRTTFT